MIRTSSSNDDDVETGEGVRARCAASCGGDEESTPDSLPRSASKGLYKPLETAGGGGSGAGAGEGVRARCAASCGGDDSGACAAEDSARSGESSRRSSHSSRSDSEGIPATDTEGEATFMEEPSPDWLMSPIVMVLTTET